MEHGHVPGSSWSLARRGSDTARRPAGGSTAPGPARRGVRTTRPRACVHLAPSIRRRGPALPVGLTALRIPRPTRSGGRRLTAAWAGPWNARASLDLAMRECQSALDLFREAGPETGLADALNAVGWFEAHLGHSQDALPLCEEALSLHRAIGHREGEAHTLDSLGSHSPAPWQLDQGERLLHAGDQPVARHRRPLLRGGHPGPPRRRAGRQRATDRGRRSLESRTGDLSANSDTPSRRNCVAACNVSTIKTPSRAPWCASPTCA